MPPPPLSLKLAPSERRNLLELLVWSKLLQRRPAAEKTDPASSDLKDAKDQSNPGTAINRVEWNLEYSQHY